MLGTPDQDKFISSQKWGVVTTLRKDGSPASSVIFYARAGDELLFSTTRDRLKGRTLAQDPRIALTVLDEGAPYRFVSVEGTATLHGEHLVEDHVIINRAMRGDPAWQAPDGMLERLEKEQRVVVRVKAERVSGVVNRG